jgi:hypothetical protein
MLRQRTNEEDFAPEIVRQITSLGGRAVQEVCLRNASEPGCVHNRRSVTPPTPTVSVALHADRRRDPALIE